MGADRDLRNTADPITGTSRTTDGTHLSFDATTFEMARGRLEDAPTDGVLASAIELSLAKPYEAPNGGQDNREVRSSGLLVGKRVVGEDGATTRVQSVRTDMATLEVPDATGFAAGEEFGIYDIAPGDHLSIPTTVSLQRNAGGYAVTAPVSVDVHLA